VVRCFCQFVRASFCDIVFLIVFKVVLTKITRLQIWVPLWICKYLIRNSHYERYISQRINQHVLWIKDFFYIFSHAHKPAILIHSQTKQNSLPIFNGRVTFHTEKQWNSFIVHCAHFLFSSVRFCVLFIVASLYSIIRKM